MAETFLRVGKGIHASHANDWGWEVSSDQMGYAWGTAGSEVEAFHDAATRLNEVIASKGFGVQAPESEAADELQQLKDSICEVLDGDSILDFADYDAFEAWLDATLEYDRRDNEDTLNGDEAGAESLLRQVYLELRAEAEADSRPVAKSGMRMR